MLRTSFVVPFVAAVVAVTLQVGCNRQNNQPVPKEVSVGPGSQQPITPKDAGEPRQVDKGPAPKDAIEIHVIGKQWLWKFQHPSGIREIGDLHVPVGQPFKLTVTSEDVIHCLAIPGQKIKVEAIPGKWTSDWTTAEKAGRYPFHCGENCGAMHAKHTGTLVVLERNEYDNWLADLLTKEPVADRALAWKGRQLFLKNQCVICHSAEAQAKGPNLEGLWGKAVAIKGGGMVRVDESYIRESILRPLAKVVEGWQPMMPAFDKDKISEEEMIALIAYIKSLKPGDTPIRTEEIPPPVGAPPEKK